MQEINNYIDIQSAMVHMAIAMRMLDSVGAKVSAAHVNSALEALKYEPVVKRTFAEVCDSSELDFTALDDMVVQFLLSSSHRQTASIGSV